jgi:MFS transporter, PHS family, inorganic phosphate transporter
MLEEKQGDDHQESVVVAKAHHQHHDVLAALDNSSLSGFHVEAMLTSGMGFFTDAYDLFIIGVAWPY